MNEATKEMRKKSREKRNVKYFKLEKEEDELFFSSPLSSFLTNEMK